MFHVEHFITAVRQLFFWDKEILKVGKHKYIKIIVFKTTKIIDPVTLPVKKRLCNKN